jgi:hypothetical protein
MFHAVPKYDFPHASVICSGARMRTHYTLTASAIRLVQRRCRFMRKHTCIAIAAAMLMTTTTVAMADTTATANTVAPAADEGALPAADVNAAQSQTVVVPGLGTLTGAQAALFLALVAAGVAAAVAFGTASGSSTGTI